MTYGLPYLGESPRIDIKNTNHKWYQMDTEYRFNLHMSEKHGRKLMEENGWTKDSITYNFNEYGFRADPFEGTGAMFFGCSHSMGVGMDWERTWPYLVANELRLKCWNLAIGGTSNDLAFRLASYWIPKLKPRYVYFLPTYPHRMELITADDGVIQFLPNFCKRNLLRDFYEAWLSAEENSTVNFDKNLRGIQSICQDNQVECFTITDEDRFENKYPDKARDMSHNGATWHKETANKFLSILEY